MRTWNGTFGPALDALRIELDRYGRILVKLGGRVTFEGRLQDTGAIAPEFVADRFVTEDGGITALGSDVLAAAERLMIGGAP